MILKTWSRSILPTLLLLACPALSMAQVSVDVSVNVAPPALPVYDQPPIPGEGYLWTPGYWAWSDDDQDYYWVPGTWILAPEPNYLWTPGYWGAEGGVFLWHAGYWGPHIGFYGGVNYGYGYGGSGFEGGYWQEGHLYYNRSVTNISTVHITNVYDKTVINNITVNRVSYNGGSGGVTARPTAIELAATRDRHITTTPVQRQHEQAARSNPGLRASANHGNPSIAATARPGTFSGAGVVAAKHGGTVNIVHSNPQPRPAQPAREPAPRSTIQEAPRQQAPREEAAPAQREIRPKQPAVVEPHRQSEQTQTPRQNAPQPRPRPEPHPAERSPERQDDNERH